MKPVGRARRLSVARQGEAVAIRFQWVQTFARRGMLVFVAVAVAILATDHGGKPWPLQTALELVWAGLVLGLVVVIAINSTYLRVTGEEVLMKTTPVEILATRVFRRSEIRGIHHWLHWRKQIRYKVTIQLAFPVQVGTFDTREEALLVAETIAATLRVECRAAKPSGGFDWVLVWRVLTIAAGLACPLVLVLLLEVWKNAD